MLSLPLGVLTARPEIVAIIIIVTTLVFVSVITVTALVLRLQQRRLWHETARLAIEKGQPVPIPSSVLRRNEADAAQSPRRRSDVRRGLALLAVGLGVYVTLLRAPNATVLYLAAYVPAFVGVALLLNALLEAWMSRKTKDAGDTPPQA